MVLLCLSRLYVLSRSSDRGENRVTDNEAPTDASGIAIDLFLSQYMSTAKKNVTNENAVPIPVR
jgi:hypothetical protein